MVSVFMVSSLLIRAWLSLHSLQRDTQQISGSREGPHRVQYMYILLDLVQAASQLDDVTV